MLKNKILKVLAAVMITACIVSAQDIQLIGGEHTWYKWVFPLESSEFSATITNQSPLQAELTNGYYPASPEYAEASVSRQERTDDWSTAKGIEITYASSGAPLQIALNNDDRTGNQSNLWYANYILPNTNGIEKTVTIHPNQLNVYYNPNPQNFDFSTLNNILFLCAFENATVNFTVRSLVLLSDVDEPEQRLLGTSDSWSMSVYDYDGNLVLGNGTGSNSVYPGTYLYAVAGDRDGMTFAGWEVISAGALDGNILWGDLSSREIEFIMPDESVTLNATYAEAPREPVEDIVLSYYNEGLPFCHNLDLYDVNIVSDGSYGWWDIVWSINGNEDNTAGASMIFDWAYHLEADNPGTVTITATIPNGLGAGQDYTKDFEINFTHGINNIVAPERLSAVGEGKELMAEVYSDCYDETDISSWSIVNANGTGAEIINGNMLRATAEGTVRVKATIEGYSQEFDIEVVALQRVEDIELTNYNGSLPYLGYLDLGSNVNIDNWWDIEWSINLDEENSANAWLDWDIYGGYKWYYLYANNPGTVTITATIGDYSEDFPINFIDAVDLEYILNNIPRLFVGENVLPATALTEYYGEEKEISWEIVNDGGTGAEIINGNILSAPTAGDVHLAATVDGYEVDDWFYIEDFEPVVDITLPYYGGSQPYCYPLYLYNYVNIVSDGNYNLWDIVWSINEDAENTAGAQLWYDYDLYASNSGTATITATIQNGLGIGRDYTKDFVIDFNSQIYDIYNVPTYLEAIVEARELTANVDAGCWVNAANISWSVVDANGTGARITGGNMLQANSNGTVRVKATIEDYYEEFDIEVYHEHDFSGDNWKVLETAKCNAEGSKTKVCPICGKTEFDFDGTLPTVIPIPEVGCEGGAAIVYDITYNNVTTVGGALAAGSPATYTVEDFDITLKTPTRTGYTFLGWYDSETGGTKWTVIASGSTGNKPFWARWVLNQYTVSFDNGVMPQTISHGSVATRPATDPARNGYTFAGWFNGETAFDFATPITGAITLTAKWTAVSYTITYNLLEGVNAATNPPTYTIETADITLAAPTKAGFLFAGWFEDEGYTVPVNPAVIARGSTGNKIFFAKWGIPMAISDKDKPSEKMLFKETIVRDKMEIALDKEFVDVRFVVYDMTGNVVVDGRGRTWDLRNRAGRFVANGSYQVVVEATAKNGLRERYAAKLGVKR